MNNSRNPIRHGHAPKNRPSPEYRCWQGILARCRNPKNKDYPKYGGRGITVSEEWKSFEVFLADMGLKPPKHTIERVDNDLGYSKSNCVWATMAVQSNNRSSTIRVEYRGQVMSLLQATTLAGLTRSIVTYRRQLGRSIESIIPGCRLIEGAQ